MNLTEPQAGSDVGALATRAEDAGDGSFRLTGQKIYITWADSELTENTSHLVLARLPDGGPGTKGISLFQVPKLIDGRPNGVHVLSLEHKMGLHGSPTCVLSYEGARGWLVGGRHKGMAAMFTLMNNARLGVGVQGIGAADAALQMAVAHARDRHQSGRAIIDWPDVRRMLAETRGQVFAARAIVIDCAIAIDMAARTGDPVWAARAGILTPIAKAFGTDTGCEAAYQAMQVHGGAGFVEGTGIAQIFRDVRVTSIYEGTNGIQALDLVGRKLADGGVAALAALEEATAHPATAHLRTPMAEAIRVMAQASPDDKQAGAVPFLRAFALILGGAAHARAAATDPGRAALARLYHQRHLPMVPALLAQARDGADTVMATLFDAA
jgi:acyl-CoA dehydrogenase